jgi:hypothetical protein
VICDDPADAELVRSQLNMRAMVKGEAPKTALKHVLVLSRKDAHKKLADLIAGGIHPAQGRFVDLSQELPLTELVAYQRERLRWLFTSAGDVHHDKVRLLSRWEQKPPFEPWLMGDLTWDAQLRWRPRSFSIVLGAYGSGKSTIAQLLGMKLLFGPTLLDRDARMSVCAWEDDIEDYRDRLGRYVNQGDYMTPERAAVALAAQNRIYWFEPDADNERLLDNYITNIRYLTKHQGVRIHICDPWNSFNHEYTSERETIYIRRVMAEFQRITAELDCSIIMATHLPKAGYTDEGRIKPFRIASAAGSIEFGNKADYGFCVQRVRSIAQGLYGDVGPSEQWFKNLDIDHVDLQAATNLGRAAVSFKPTEHTLVTIDKVKIEGFHERGMGRKGTIAFVLDRERGDFIVDPAATYLANRAIN